MENAKKVHESLKKERKIMTFAFVGNDWGVLRMDDTYMSHCSPPPQ